MLRAHPHPHVHLQAVREQSAVRESEHRLQREKLRGEKKELEARLGGVDLKQIQVCVCVGGGA